MNKNKLKRSMVNEEMIEMMVNRIGVEKTFKTLYEWMFYKIKEERGISTEEAKLEISKILMEIRNEKE